MVPPNLPNQTDDETGQTDAPFSEMQILKIEMVNLISKDTNLSFYFQFTHSITLLAIMT